ncbi:hypothetical protein [Kineosporia babensis]|uniref:Uncharacterized protein n=1 Tax=Kineosporia babensis TaxID=499548 RepID=A0A9X1NN64_9ACTN|nr:hypothetical protein [Kineosporia babensis]MCD5317195.1 hypothetical protein [Kineosporia babensis]
MPSRSSLALVVAILAAVFWLLHRAVARDARTVLAIAAVLTATAGLLSAVATFL